LTPQIKRLAGRADIERVCHDRSVQSLQQAATLRLLAALRLQFGSSDIAL
jgi:hypothetical protein